MRGPGVTYVCSAERKERRQEGRKGRKGGMEEGK